MMRASVLVSALLALAHFAAGETNLFQQNDELATVSQQRGRSLLQTVPLYGCPLSTYPTERKVEVYVTVTGAGRKARATFGKGQLALFNAIKGVYTRFGRDSIIQSQIVGPRGQIASLKSKTFLYIFTLPIGQCGSDKKLLDTNLRRAIATLKTAPVRGAKIALWK